MNSLSQLISSINDNSSQNNISNIIIQATELSGIYVFGELLTLDKIKENPKKHLLELFAYGTYKDYLNNKQEYDELNEKQILKLQMLTIASLCASHKVLSYKLLQDNLGINNIRELENLIIECIYEGIIKAKLDQQKKEIIVEYSIGRDLKHGDLDLMINVLEQWEYNSSIVLNTINNQKKFIQSEHCAIESMKEQTKRLIENNKEIISNKLGNNLS